MTNEAAPQPSDSTLRQHAWDEAGRRIAAEDEGLPYLPKPAPQPAAPAQLSERLQELIGHYWSLAYAEGVEGRTQDTKDGAAQRTLHEINEAIAILAAQAPQQPDKDDLTTPVQSDGALSATSWVPVSERLPDYDEHARVLVHTEGHDFGGEQFFDIPVLDFYYAADDEEITGTEVTRVASHWMPRPHLRPVEDEKKRRLDELARTIAYANGLGVRAEVVGDEAQKAEAARIYHEAMEEIALLRASTGADTERHGQHEMNPAVPAAPQGERPDEPGVCRSCDGTGIEGIDRGECAMPRCRSCKSTGTEPRSADTEGQQNEGA